MYEHYAVRVSQHKLNRREAGDEEGESFHILYNYDGDNIGSYYPESHIMILSLGGQYLTEYAIKAVADWFRINPDTIDIEYA